MDIEPGDINPQLVQLGLTAIALAVKDGTYTWEQWVGLDDGYLHKFATASAITLDMGYLPDADTEPITVAANVSVTLDNINGDIFADVEPPAAFLPLDDSDDFLVGGESMIDAQLEVGQAFSGALTEGDDETDMYGVTLSTGQTVSIEITTDGGSTTLELYGPDGFSVAWFDSYSADALEYTAEQEGRYMLVVEGYWDIKYEVIVRLK
ncbi:MAG: PPC domain-containing protein, partial [Anaerolineae bacterium]|nr:PPC domain-containing protein [Anaerolineae bacterium]